MSKKTNKLRNRVASLEKELLKYKKRRFAGVKCSVSISLPDGKRFDFPNAMSDSVDMTFDKMRFNFYAYSDMFSPMVSK